MSFFLKFIMDVFQDISYGDSWPQQPIFKTSIKILVMEPVGPDGQNNLFSRSNEHQSSPCIFGVLEFWRHFCQKISWTSIKTFVIEPVGPHDQNIPFSRSYDPRSRISTSFLPKFFMDLWSQLALTAKTTHFQGQTSLEEGKPLILPVFVCYSSPSFLVIQNFDIIFAKFFLGRPLKLSYGTSWP
ncbi:hypothetical protein H5410_052977 [Solanum commersonii]|uniref:Uncharacterized protein n=1 Tax=Solanum commersonii TaxID=4109 RepID=A0A9J5X543_SOLCO|nr:hypothetical protein H5410_052977 [Solanum commersonii]